MIYTVPHLLGKEPLVDTTTSVIPIYNPAHGEEQGQLYVASELICNQAIERAQQAFVNWSEISPSKRIQVFFKFRNLLEKFQNDLAKSVTQEHGKTLEDAKGSILRGIELVEFHCGLLGQLQGSWSNNVSSHIDCFTFRQPLGVCAGISPFNFPVMVPLWMMIPAIACGNTFILKPSEQAPSAPNRLVEWLYEAGLPDNVVHCLHGDKTTVDYLLNHPKIAAITAVASTPVAESIYQKAIQQGKRCMTFGGAKNHCMVMPDADMQDAARAIVGAAYGSAGERCMAISAVVAVENAADELIDALIPLIKAIRVDCGENVSCDMGPLISSKHRQKVLQLIDEGVQAGADLRIDGRGFKHAQYPQGYYLGPSLFDRVTEDMSIYQQEIFGPVLVVLRVKSFEEALSLVNRNAYGNGTAIFTSQGYYAREYTRRVQVGMVGVNIPIPVPIASHPFGGWKRSAFGDNAMHGTEGIHFYTKLKTITSKWTKQDLANQFSMPTHD